jgi:hypothetical protein
LHGVQEDNLQVAQNLRLEVGYGTHRSSGTASRLPTVLLMNFTKIIRILEQPSKADKSAMGAIMQFQKYMWIIKEARAAYKPDFIIGINF